MPTEESQETRIALLLHRLEDVEKTMQEWKEQREKGMIWGIVTLGAVVITLSSFILKTIAPSLKL